MLVLLCYKIYFLNSVTCHAYLLYDHAQNMLISYTPVIIILHIAISLDCRGPKYVFNVIPKLRHLINSLLKESGGFK